MPTLARNLQLSQKNHNFVARKNNITMETIEYTENVQLTVPTNDISFLRSIAKRMGWVVKRPRKSGIEKGMEDIRKGNVFHAKNSEDLIKQILG